MATWAEFVKTMQPENEMHVHARCGNIEGLRTAVDSLREDESIDLQDARGHSALMLACYNGQIEAAEYLLSRGADPDLRDFTGNTSLMGAAFKGHIGIAQLLVERGAQIHLVNPQGLSALGFATMFGRHEVAEYLSGYLSDVMSFEHVAPI